MKAIYRPVKGMVIFPRIGSFPLTNAEVHGEAVAGDAPRSRSYSMDRDWKEILTGEKTSREKPVDRLGLEQRHRLKVQRWKSGGGSQRLKAQSFP